MRTGGGRKLTYLELPLLLGIRAPWKISPQLLVGPSLSYEVQSSVTGVSGVGTVSGSDPRVAWERERFLPGIWFGIGVGKQLNRGRLTLRFMGNVSLTNINREALPSGYVRLITVTTSVTYKIPLGGT